MDRGELYRIIWAALLVVVVLGYTGVVSVDVADVQSASDNATDGVSESVDDGVDSVESSTTLNKTALRLEIHNEVNSVRENKGLNRLLYNPALESIAQAHSESMAEQGYFSHTSPDGVSMSDRYREGDVGCAGAENIFRTTSTVGDESDIARSVVKGWMTSEGHRENLLGSHSLEGIGIAIGKYEGDRNLFVTQNFC